MVWSGEHVPIGLYEAMDEPIADASRRTVERMVSKLEPVTHDARVLDLGGGDRGAARVLVSTLHCEVVTLDLSDGLESIEQPDASFDVVWSRDAIMHSDDRPRVMGEIARVLAPGGQLVFTDPMQSDSCPPHALQPILDRAHLTDLGSPCFYREQASAHGLEEVSFELLTKQLVTHYTRVLHEAERRHDELSTDIAADDLDQIKAGLRYWIDGGAKSHLVWGIFHFRRPGAAP